MWHEQREIVREALKRPTVTEWKVLGAMFRSFCWLIDKTRGLKPSGEKQSPIGKGRQ